MNDPRGYDATQMAAVLTYCLACHRWFYMTRPQPICCRCRQKEQATTTISSGL